MKRVLYDGRFEITLREVLFSIIIIAVFVGVGSLVSEKITSYIDENNQSVEQALKINNDAALFEYAMRTNAGDAFVSGTLAAVDTVSMPDIEGNYAGIAVDTERYTRHTREVRHEKDGKVWYTEEEYWIWDLIDSEEINCNKIKFLEHEFEYGQIGFPAKEYLTTIKCGYHLRNKYYVNEVSYNGVIRTKLKDNTITKTNLMSGLSVEEAVNRSLSNTDIVSVIFWMVWICFTAFVTYMFFVGENKWIED